jgi:hypothetical protein
MTKKALVSPARTVPIWLNFFSVKVMKFTALFVVLLLLIPAA